MPDNDDKTVKELIDAGTRADLERWFGLPSFEQLEEAKQPKRREDPEMAAAIKRRDTAMAAVDPAMLDRLRRRAERQRDIYGFKATIETRLNPDMALIDQGMIDKRHTIAEPREYDLPYELSEALTHRTPQALLRDLHRPELNFDKMFEIVDLAAENRIDLPAIISEALAYRPASSKGFPSKVREARALLLELRNERRKPWTDLTPKMRNRRVTE